MIKCPYCGELKNLNLETRNTGNGRVRRRRECCGCGRKFTTYEVFVEEIKNEMAFMKGKRGPKK